MHKLQNHVLNDKKHNFHITYAQPLVPSQTCKNSTFGILFMPDSDVPVVAAASRLPQGSLQPPRAAGDRTQLIRHPLVPDRLCFALPSWLCGQSLW